MKMRIAMLVWSTLSVVSAPWVVADETKQSRTDNSPAAGRSPASDASRFRFYQGRWWYWLPTNYWAVYENGRWLMPVQGNPPPEARPSRSAVTATRNKTGAPPAATSAMNNTQGGSFAEDYPAVPVGPEDARQSAEYYMSVGTTFSRHAHEHARILERYAASGDTVPARIVKEQAAAIHHDVEQAAKSFSKLATVDEQQGEDLPPAAAVKKLQEGLQEVRELLRQLESRVQHQGAVQAELVRGQSAIIANLLGPSDETAETAKETRQLPVDLGRRPPGTIQHQKNSPRGED